LRRTLRQIAHLRSHHPEPASCIARARGSTAALSASRFVCRAISSIIPIISRFCATTPRSASSRPPFRDHLAAAARDIARAARGLVACCAFSAFFFTVTAISSIEAEVCSRLAACCSVRWDKSVVLIDISLAALVISRAAALSSATVAAIRSASRWRRS